MTYRNKTVQRHSLYITISAEWQQKAFLQSINEWACNFRCNLTQLSVSHAFRNAQHMSYAHHPCNACYAMQRIIHDNNTAFTYLQIIVIYNRTFYLFVHFKSNLKKIKTKAKQVNSSCKYVHITRILHELFRNKLSRRLKEVSSNFS